MLAWEIVYPLGALILGLGLAYGLWRNYTRNRRNDAVTEAATREEYDNPERYKRQTREALNREAKRNEAENS